MVQGSVDEAGQGIVDLLAQIAGGDKAAFAKLYGLTSRKLFGVALRIVRDRSAAEDILQDAYFRVWRHADSFDPALASPIAWMASIVRNSAIDAHRKQKPELLELGDESENVAINEPDPALEIDMAQRRAVAFAALKKLPAEKRELILQAYLREISRDSLAKRRGVPTGTIKTHLRRSLLELRHSIQREERRASSSLRRGSRSELKAA